MRKPLRSLTRAFIWLLLAGLSLGLTGSISAFSALEEPINYYPERVSLID